MVSLTHVVPKDLGYSRKGFNWRCIKVKEEYELMYRNKHTNYKVVVDFKEKSVFRIQWPAGVLSEDYYSKNRAGINLVDYYRTYHSR